MCMKICSSISAGNADSKGSVLVDLASSNAEVMDLMPGLLRRRFLRSVGSVMNTVGYGLKAVLIGTSQRGRRMKQDRTRSRIRQLLSDEDSTTLSSSR